MLGRDEALPCRPSRAPVRAIEQGRAASPASLRDGHSARQGEPFSARESLSAHRPLPVPSRDSPSSDLRSRLPRPDGDGPRWRSRVARPDGERPRRAARLPRGDEERPRWPRIYPGETDTDPSGSPALVAANGAEAADSDRSPASLAQQAAGTKIDSTTRRTGRPERHLRRPRAWPGSTQAPEPAVGPQMQFDGLHANRRTHRVRAHAGGPQRIDACVR